MSEISIHVLQANKETLEALEEVNSRRGLSGPYHTIEELREALDS